MTRRFARMLPFCLLPVAGAWLSCTELGEFDPDQGFGGATSSSSTSAAGTGGSGGLECDVLETNCSGTCANRDSDPMHCGTCDHSCQGGECQAGTCQPLVLYAAGSWIYDITLDATHVYWTDNEGAVRKVSIDGGDPITILEGGIPYVRVKVDENNLYLVRNTSWELVQMPIAGGTQISLDPGEGEGIRDIQMSSTHVFYTKGDSTRTVNKVPIGGGMPVVLAEGTDPPEWTPYGMTLVGTTLYWTEGAGSLAFPDGLIRSIPTSGGAPVTLATEQWFPWQIWALGENLYWRNGRIDGGDGGGGSVQKMPIAGGTPTTVMTNLLGGIDMAMDSTHFYWTADEGNNHGTLMRATISGGEQVTLVELIRNPSHIRLDATSIYWTVWDNLESEGRIMKLAK